MSSFVNITPENLTNVFDLIGKQWMLITAGDENGYNTMTASWGALGVLWKKNVAHCYIRTGRHTLGFVDSNDYYTLSFFGEEYRNALAYCGKYSGRDVDKAKECGLTPVHENGITYFAEAQLVLICRKLYRQQFDPSCFIDGEINTQCYPQPDHHFQFIGEIVRVLKAK